MDIQPVLVGEQKPPEPQPQVQEPQPQETIEPTPTPEPKPTIDHEPPPDHPRFKEIYGKMKHYERQIAEAEERHKELLEHNEKLNESISILADRVDVQQRPDPAVDPEKYEEWLTQRITRDVEKKFKHEQKLPELPLPQYQQQPQQQNIDWNKTNIQIAAMQATYGKEQYNKFAMMAEYDMANDPVLRNEIWSDENPPLKAYEYAKEKMARAEQQKQQLNAQTFSESPSQGQPPPTATLSDAEKIAAIRLGIGEESYLKQKQSMIKAGIWRGQ